MPIDHSRTYLLFILAAFCLSLLPTHVHAKNKRPNVLFIISDDLSANALGCYGNTQCQTPNIDGIAERGVRFDRAYCQFPVCGPSRAALMSGLYCQQVGVMSNGQSDRFTEILGQRPTMSQHFIQHGYQATRISKIYHMLIPGNITNGISGPDHAASWSQAFNCPGPEQWTKGEHEHLSNGKLKPDPERNIHYRLGYGGAFYVVKASHDAKRQPDAQAADKAIEILSAHQNEENKKPFFLAVGLIRPHVPLVAPAAYFDKYPVEKLDVPHVPEGDVNDIPKAGRKGDYGLNTKLKKQKALAAYYASVTFMDDQVGRILKALNDLKLDQDTIVVFSSDHGWHLGEHNFWQKMSLHEESARIPLIIANPGTKPATTKSLAEQIDLFPTLADLAGLPVPEHLSGHSLKKVLANPEHEVRDAAYTTMSKGKHHFHLIRTKRWAYMDYGKEKELYDMDKDPMQFNNLAKNPEYAQTMTKLKKKLDTKLRGF